MTKSLEFLGLEFLRFEKGCPVALWERSPRYMIGQPDVLGVNKARFLYEIEIKRSVSDFRADAKKPHRKFRIDEHAPRLFWYLVPHHLVDSVSYLVPEWAGLLRGPTDSEVQQVWSVKKSPQNAASKRLTTKECVSMAHCMANQIYSTWRRDEEKRLNEHFINEWAMIEKFAAGEYSI